MDECNVNQWFSRVSMDSPEQRCRRVRAWSLSLERFCELCRWFPLSLKCYVEQILSYGQEWLCILNWNHSLRISIRPSTKLDFHLQQSTVAEAKVHVNLRPFQICSYKSRGTVLAAMRVFVQKCSCWKEALDSWIALCLSSIGMPLHPHEAVSGEHWIGLQRRTSVIITYSPSVVGDIQHGCEQWQGHLRKPWSCPYKEIFLCLLMVDVQTVYRHDRSNELGRTIIM